MNIKLSGLIAPSFYELHKKLKNDQDISELWLKGGRGSTKSTFASIEIILGMIRDKEANAVVCRRYQNELRDTVYGQFEWTISRMGLSDAFNCLVSPMQIIYRKTGQKIVFKAADNPRKLKSMNLGKGYIKYAWFEELDQFGGMGEIRNIVQSLFRGEDKQRILIFSYNPPKSGRSWVNQESKISKSGRTVHNSDYRDVPKEWLGERFLADAEHLKSVNDTAYRHEYLGEEVGTGLEVFTNVELRQLPSEERATFDKIRQGLDFGYAVDPLCFERMYFDSTRRRLYFLDEISGINLFNRQFFDLAENYRGTLTTADSAEPKSIDELKSFGMVIRGAKKGPGSVEFGVKFLQDLEAIIIDIEKCPRAAKEFVNYALEKDRNGEIKSQFIDKDNHSIDASRYGLEDDMVLQKPVGSSQSTSRAQVEEMFN